jgi:polyhydroxyalkanoate synthesis regulator phasin
MTTQEKLLAIREITIGEHYLSAQIVKELIDNILREEDSVAFCDLLHLLGAADILTELENKIEDLNRKIMDLEDELG